MTHEHVSERASAHVSELAIDRLLAGELPGTAANALRVHAAACPRCRALLDDARAGQRAFALEHPRLQLPNPMRRRVPMAASMSAAAALAAVLALVIVWPGHDAGRDERRGASVVRTKGGAIVGFFVAHGGDVRRGAVREVVVPGDRIELFTTTTEPAWFAAVSDDANGVRSTYVEPRRIEPGREQVVPMSIELDGVLGPQPIVGIFCADAFASTAAIDVDAPPAGCTIDRFELVVVPR